MRQFKMKICEKYLPSIIRGEKGHEYRVATPNRLEVKVGDQLVLVGKDDPTKYARVNVIDIKHYSDWYEPLDLYWKEDFSNLYSSKEAVLEELRRYYSPQEIQQWGVIVFGIQSDMVFSLQKKRVLLDADIVIHKEYFESVTFEVSSLYQWLDKLNCTKLIHPISAEEIDKFVEKDSKVTTANNATPYEVLKASSKTDDEFEKAIASLDNDPYEETTNKLLYEAYCGNVDILVTDDKVLLQKAEQLYLTDRVMSVDQFLKRAETEFPKLIDYKMLSVRKKKFGALDLNDPFFDSLKEDYPGFEQWFCNKREQEAYVFESEGIHGFLYLKIETQEEPYSDITPTFSPAKRLKVGTFKIDSNLKGFRLGERFLKIIFDNALKADVDEIYVTLFEHKRDEVSFLKTMLEEWGFEKWGEKKSGEAVLVKKMHSYDPEKSPKYNFPNLSPSRHLFFLPIKPEYHTGLFPDAILTNEDMSLYSAEKGHLYSLEKIYVTNADPSNVKPGDLLIIYRMGTCFPKKYSSVCTAIAVFEKAVTPNSLEDYLKECKNKSIFEENELKRFYNSFQYTTVVKMILLKTLAKKITLNELQKKGLVDRKSGPRPFDLIAKEDIIDFFNH